MKFLIRMMIVWVLYVVSYVFMNYTQMDINVLFFLLLLVRLLTWMECVLTMRGVIK